MFGRHGRAGWRGDGSALLIAGLLLGGNPAAALAGNAPPADSGALLVVWREAPSSAAARREWTPAAVGLDGEGIETFEPLFPAHTTPGDPLARFWRVMPDPTADEEQLLVRLRRDPRFSSVDVDRVLPLATALPDDPYFAHANPDSTQWGLRNGAGPDLRAIDAWNVSTGDSTLLIGLIDSGTDWHHPEFAADPGPGGTIALNRAEYAGVPGVDDDANGFVDDIRGWDFVEVRLIPGETSRADTLEDRFDPDNDPNDYEGHGTFVGGIMSARMDDGLGVAGVAPGCRLMPLRAGWRQDYRDPNTGQRIVRGVISMLFCAQAIVYAADNGVRILNCSWESDSTAALKAALDYAIGEKGMIVIGAATNGGLSETQVRNYLSRRGDCLEVCAVDRSGFIVPQSSVGRWVDLSAPGHTIISLAPASFGRRYSVFGGATSWAAPHVAGTAALLLSAEPGLDREGVFQRLRETATNLDGQNGIFAGKMGSGMVNAAAALRSDVVNPSTALASTPATAPAWLSDGSAVFTTSGEHLVRVEPRAARVDSFPLLVAGPIGGVAYLAPDPEPALALTFGRGQVSLNSLEGEARPGWPRPTGGLLPGGPVATERGELYVAGTDSLLHAWETDGRPVNGFPVRLADGCVAAPAVGDIERDGRLEAAVLSVDGTLTLIDDAGGVRAGWPRATNLTGHVAPLMGDLDGDGRLDIIVADETGRIDAWSAAGVRIAGWPRSLGGALAGEPALADLDGDDRAEVLACRADRLFVLDGAGADRPGWPVALREPPVGGPLAGRVTTGHAGLQVVAGLAGGCVVAFDASGIPLQGWPKRLSGPIEAPPALLPGGGPFDPYLVAITVAGRLESFLLPSLLQSSDGHWGTLGGDPGRTRTQPATAPVTEPDVTPGPVPRPLAFAPNPFRAETVAFLELRDAGAVRIEWFTADGRRVRRDDCLAGAGPFALAWDGRDGQGHPLPAGVYHYRVQTRDAVRTGRVVRLR